MAIRLNEEQRQAVETIEGPVLVIAGPGTGKTQLLSARVAHILEVTDTNPENILCLTFTEKAAQNMKQRLLDTIGVGARRVMIKTFHWLAMEIMNAYPECFWNAARLQPAPEAIKLEIITDILNRLPLDNPLALKFNEQFTLVKDVLNSINKAKEAGLSPEKLAALTNANLAYINEIQPLFQSLVAVRVSKKQIADYRILIEQLPDLDFSEFTAPLQPLSVTLKVSLTAALDQAEEESKTTSLSAWKQTWFETKNGQKVFKDLRRNQWWLELSRVYALYQKAMQKSRYLDFADMILEVIKQLEQNETMRADIQEHFSYLMIDEFQDTNDAQFRMSYLISNNPVAEGRPNILAVGDDDQAIYRFQGAQLSNAKQFLNSYKDTKLIVLTKNYRSHQSVLDTAEKIAQQIQYRLIHSFEDLNKNIQAEADVAIGKIEHRQFLNSAEEYRQIAKDIKEHSKKPVTIAVLARKHQSLEAVANQLNKLGVPIRYERSSNILEHPAVVLVTELAKVLQTIHSGERERTNQLLAEILAHPAWQISSETLWRLALSQASRGANWLDMLLNHPDKKLDALATWFLDLSKSARHQPLSQTIEHLIGLRDLDGFTSPIRDYYLGSELSSDYIFALTALERLRSLSREYARDENVSLDEFLSYIEINREHHVVIANESAIVTGENAVQLMTVHKAKGLEFDTVYLLDANENQWKPSSRGKTPPSNLETLQGYGEEEDDYARLLFVAITRAKSNLIIASAMNDEQGKEILPISYVHDIKNQIIPAEDDAVEAAEASIMWPEISHAKKKQLLKPIIEDYQLSATGLTSFLDVTHGGPDQFVLQHILRVPGVKSATLSFGSAIHSALEQAQKLTNGSGFALKDIIASYEQALKAEFLEANEYGRYLEKGTRLLTHLIEDKILSFKPGDSPERFIDDVRVGNACIKGVLDLVKFNENGVMVADYKTGRPLKSLTSTTKADGVRAWKHRTQLIYYSLLVSEKGLIKPGQEINAQMLYIEAEDPDAISLNYQASDEELDRLKLLIQAVWQKLQQCDFPDISSYEASLAGITKFEDDLISHMI
jgi:DNA helicase-2/ATP-dependent DNA helicase PcrA